MNEETKNKVMIVFFVSTFLMLFSFQGSASDLNSETLAFDSSEEIIEEEPTPVYIPASEDAGDEGLSIEAL